MGYVRDIRHPLARQIIALNFLIVPDILKGFFFYLVNEVTIFPLMKYRIILGIVSREAF
jgi:hypothetical protein